MASKIVFKHYQRVLALWPVDLVRPEVSFQDVMRRRIEKRLLPLSSSSTTPLQPQDKVRANDALATPAPNQQFDEKRELEQVNVLYSLLENRYHKMVRGKSGNLSPRIFTFDSMLICSSFYT